MVLRLARSVPTKFETLLCHLKPLESRQFFPKLFLCLEFSNWVITVVSEHDIRTYWIPLFIFPHDELPPLETDTGYINNGREESGEVSSFYKEIKAKLGLGDMDDKENNEDLNTFIKSSFEGMNKHIMQGFELLSIQLGGKSTPGSSSSSPHVEKKTNGETIFSTP